MFTVTFIVSFGPKKGNLSAYAGYWYANFYNTFQLLTSYNTTKGTLKSLS